MSPRPAAAAVILVALTVGACVRAQPPTDTGDPTAVGNPLAPSNQRAALAYDPDLKAIFASDCAKCHGGAAAAGNYRVTTYADVMAAVEPGSESSRLVRVTQSDGSMYRYFSGATETRRAKADAVWTWIVTFKAQENR
jgi:hypothetical protein